MPKRLPIISDSVSHGGGDLDHCASEIQDFLESLTLLKEKGGARKIRKSVRQFVKEHAIPSWRHSGQVEISTFIERRPLRTINETLRAIRDGKTSNTIVLIPDPVPK